MAFLRRVISLLVLSLIAFSCGRRNNGLVIVGRSYSQEDTSHYFLTKTWVLDTMARYYLVDSITSKSPFAGSNSWMGHNSKPLSVRFKVGPANIQIKNLNTGQWYTLMQKNTSFGIKENTAIIEDRYPPVLDSSAYFQTNYVNAFKIIHGMMGQKVICKHRQSGRVDSVYILPNSKDVKSNLFFRDKYGLKDVIIESYQQLSGGKTVVNQIVQLERKKIEESIFDIPVNYKRVKRNSISK